MTIVYDPVKFTVEKGDALGMRDDVLQEIQWPVKKIKLMEIFKEKGVAGSNRVADAKIKSMLRAGDLVWTDDHELARPDIGPKIEGLSTEEL